MNSSRVKENYLMDTYKTPHMKEKIVLLLIFMLLINQTTAGPSAFGICIGVSASSFLVCLPLLIFSPAGVGACVAMQTGVSIAVITTCLPLLFAPTP